MANAELQHEKEDSPLANRRTHTLLKGSRASRWRRNSSNTRRDRGR